MEDVSQKWVLEVFENAEEEGSGLFEEGETKEKETKECERKETRASEQHREPTVFLHQLFGQLPVG